MLIIYWNQKDSFVITAKIRKWSHFVKKLSAHLELTVFYLFFWRIKTSTSLGYRSTERTDSYNFTLGIYHTANLKGGKEEILNKKKRNLLNGRAKRLPNKNPDPTLRIMFSISIAFTHFSGCSLLSSSLTSCIHDISHCCQVKKKLDEVDLKPVWDVPENPQSEQ